MNRGVRFLACVVLVVLAVFMVGWITMSLWNWLVPSLFNGPIITLWQALGLLLLSKLLLWGFGGKRSWQGRYGTHETHWKSKFYDKFSSMTPEERELVKRKMKDKWCTWQDRNEPKRQEDAND